MADTRSPTQGQRWIGYLVGGIAAAIAVAPLALALAIPGREGSAVALFFVIAALLWMLAVVIHRGLSLSHDRWRRRMLRNEIAEIRRARLDASEAFQGTLHTQIAILDRIVDIADSLLTDGIIDPITALENVRMVASHAEEAKGFAEDSIAAVRIETGATSFEMVHFDIRTEIETIAAPFIRAGHKLTTGGSQCIVNSDPAALRIIVRGLISWAIEQGATEVDVTVAQDGDRVVCMVADTGPDRTSLGVAGIPRVPVALAAALGADMEHGYTLGWNRHGLALPTGSMTAARGSSALPMDVLGVRRRKTTAAVEPPPLPRLSHDAVIEFTINPDPDRLEAVVDRQ
jgi:hypothetical protein